MTFLKKLGSIALRAGQIALGLQPMISPEAHMFPAVGDAIDRIFSAIGNVEAIGQALSLAGTEKLTAAAVPVEQILLDVVHAKGWKIADEAKFRAACTSIAGSVADLLNAIHEDSADAIKVTK